MTTEHSTDEIREQYVEARAAELAFADVIGQIQNAINGLQQRVSMMERAASGATGAAKAFRTVAKSLGLDWSDKALGEELGKMIEKTTQEVREQAGIGSAPTGPPTGGGVMATRSRHGVRPSAMDGVKEEPTPETTVGAGASREPQEPSEPEEAPQGQPTGEPLPGGDEEPQEPPPKPRLVRKEGGKISQVSERAKAAMARVKNPSPGDTGRKDAMIDEQGRMIPVDEQIVVDDEPPQPGEGEREEGDKPVKERRLD